MSPRTNHSLVAMYPFPPNVLLQTGLAGYICGMSCPRLYTSSYCVDVLHNLDTILYPPCTVAPSGGAVEVVSHVLHQPPCEGMRCSSRNAADRFLRYRSCATYHLGLLHSSFKGTPKSKQLFQRYVGFTQSCITYFGGVNTSEQYPT